MKTRVLLPLLTSLACGLVMLFVSSRPPRSNVAEVLLAEPAPAAPLAEALDPVTAPVADPVDPEPLPDKAPPLMAFLSADGNHPVVDFVASPGRLAARRFTLDSTRWPNLREIAEGSVWEIPIPDRGSEIAKVNLSRADEGKPSFWTLGGEIGDGLGSLYLAEDREHGLVSGWIQLWESRTSWVLRKEGEAIVMEEMPLGSVVCLPFGSDRMAAPVGNEAAPNPAAKNSGGGAIPACSSRPTATSVLYLDFEGGSLAQAHWNCGNTVTYSSAGLDNITMQAVWAAVAEDFAPFDVNVTTVRSTYTGAPSGRRMRIVITTTEWMKPINGNVSGIASIGSFPNSGAFSSLRASLMTNAGWDPNQPQAVPTGSPASCLTPIAFPTDTVCWMFMGQYYGSFGQPTGTLAVREISSAITHEFGHTIGLLHDSTTAFDTSPGVFANAGEYYGGHASGQDSWAPLMGNYLSKSFSQWSRGDFTGGINRGVTTLQDDVTIIGNVMAGGAGTGTVDEDGKGDNIAAAAPLNILPDGAVSDKGVIFSATDEDYFRIPIVGTGSVGLAVEASPNSGNLDVEAQLLNSSGTVVVSGNGDLTRAALLATGNLSAGNYYLRVRGSTQGTAATGWTRYGNLGSYTIGGAVNGSGGAPVIQANGTAPNGAVGVSYSYALNATNNPTSYYLVNGSGVMPPGLLLSSGAITGVPTQQGVFSFTLAAANAQGGTAKSFTLFVFGAVNLVESVDAPTLPWSTRSFPSSQVATTLWQGQRQFTQDGSDAARSGTSGPNSESWLETEVPGPGILTFYWRTSSHSGDRLAFRLDNTDQFDIGGELGWAQRTVTIGQGTHFPRWIYRTDPGTTAGENAGFVDRVVYTQAPQFTSHAYSGGVVGRPFSWQVETSNAVTSYGLNLPPLPPGTTLNASTGLVSGIPTSIGLYEPEISATNGGGTSLTYPSMYIYPDIPLATGLDTSGITWVTGGDSPWFGDTTPNRDGRDADAAHSGPIRHRRSSFLQTTVTGPAMVSFWWKASTELADDPVILTIDGVERTRLSGEVDWTQRSENLTAGTHVLRWEYIRDGGGNGGQNMAWVDQFSVVTGNLPQYVGAADVSGVVGTPVNFQVLFSNSPTAYGVDSLPFGLTLDTTTGVISGTPSGAVTTLSNVYGTNAFGGGQGTIRWTITAPQGLPVFRQPYRILGEAGRPFYARLRATNGGSNWEAFAYSFYDGTLPPGLSLNPATGEITGTPTSFWSGIHGWRFSNAVGPALGRTDISIVQAGRLTYNEYGSFYRLGSGPNGTDNILDNQNLYRDLDRDGQNNYQEFLARTDPTDPESVLRMRSTVSAGVFPSTVRLLWDAVPGVRYHAESSPNGVAWTLLVPVNATGQPAASPVEAVAALTTRDYTFDYLGAMNPSALFRIRVAE